jgi:hypothetical protein
MTWRPQILALAAFAALVALSAQGAVPPVVDNDSASNIKLVTARLNGYLSVTGGAPTTVRIYWGTTDGGTVATNWANVTNLGVRSVGPFSASIFSLQPSTLYYYRCWASNAAGVAWAPASTGFVMKAQHALQIVSPHGVAIPPVGLYTNAYGALVTNRISRQQIVAATQYVARGWSLVGHAPASGATTNFTMTVTNSATLRWLWTTNYFLDTATNGPGAVNVPDGWMLKGSNVVVTANPAAHYHFVRWSGDTNGCTLNGAQITAPMSRPRAITAHFAIDRFTIAASASPGGTIQPAGNILVDYGKSTNFTVQAATLYDVAQVLVDGSPVGTFGPGSNTFAWTFSNVTTGHTIHADFVVETGEIQATHACPGYRSPATNTVTCSFAYPAGHALLSLRWRPLLTNQWTLVSASGHGSPQVVGDAIEFAGLLTNNPISFTYQFAVPVMQRGSNVIAGEVRYFLQDMVASNTVFATPNPRVVWAYHAADYQPAFAVVDNPEISRVLTYWRAGAYGLSPATPDRYAGGAGDTNGLRHTADYRNPAWVLDGAEINRVLAYWRSAGYHVNPLGLDGYAAGPKNPFGLYAASSGAGAAPSVQQILPATYDPGQPFTITYALTLRSPLLSLGLRPNLPAGWEVAEIAGPAAPEYRRGEFVWTGRLPSDEVRFTCTVLVPLQERGVRTLGADADYCALGMPNAAVQSAAGPALAPTDADRDGLPDAWERHFAGSTSAMDPAADDDGDGLTNYAESLAGTNPHDAASSLRLVAVPRGLLAGPSIRWPSEVGRAYSLLRAADIGGPFLPVATGLPATPPVNEWSEPAPAPAGRAFYRVVLEP